MSLGITTNGQFKMIRNKTFTVQVLAIFMMILPLQKLDAQVIFFHLGEDASSSAKEALYRIHYDGNHFYSITSKELHKMMRTKHPKLNYKLNQFKINKERKKLEYTKEIRFTHYPAGFINLFFQKNQYLISPFTRRHQNILTINNSGDIIDEIIINRQNSIDGLTFMGFSPRDKLIMLDRQQNQIHLYDRNLNHETSFSSEHKSFTKNIKFKTDLMSSYTTVMDSTSVRLNLLNIHLTNSKQTEILFNPVERTQRTETNGFVKYEPYYVLREYDDKKDYYRVYSIEDSLLVEIKSIVTPRKKHRTLNGMTRDLYIFSERIHDPSGLEITGANVLLIKSKDDFDKLEKNKNLYWLAYKGVYKHFVVKDNDDIFLLSYYSKKSKGLKLTPLKYHD